MPFLSKFSAIIRLEDGFVLDKKVLHNEFVNLTHNMGVFLYDDLLAIVSLRNQTIHILQIRDCGNLVDVRAIGAFCREDDELFLNSNAQASGIYFEAFNVTSLSFNKHSTVWLWLYTSDFLELLKSIAFGRVERDKLLLQFRSFVCFHGKRRIFV